MLLAVVVLAIGVAYDLVAKGTPWSWLPFAVGIPILPVFGWVGRDGALARLLRRCSSRRRSLAGAGLAIANARVDVERDARPAIASVATSRWDRTEPWSASTRR